MGRIRIAYICGFSNSIVREKLSLKRYIIRNFIYSLVGRRENRFIDYAVWNSAFIQEFEKCNEYEFYVISPHAGMQQSKQEFSINGVNYIFFRSNYSLITDAIYSILKVRERTSYKDCRKRISSIIDKLKPDIAVVCGAEQPYYSPCILDIEGIPVYVLLQTLVSLPSLRSMMKYSNVFYSVEKMVFPQIRYAAAGRKYLDYLRENHFDFQCLPIAFPTILPQKSGNIVKNTDFIFYAATLSRNKGVEDVLRAFNILYSKHPSSTLLISGACDDDYLYQLKSIVCKDALASGKVTFTGLCDSIEEKFLIVQSARIAVLPGITAPLNSTVRESMLLGMPTIVYETSSTHIINQGKRRLIEANMQDIDDLADKMIYAFENPEEIAVIADFAYNYAKSQFNNHEIALKLYKNINAIIDNYYHNIAIPKELVLD